eukprot:9938-Heterococcus_DN1.PRE.1
MFSSDCCVIGTASSGSTSEYSVSTSLRVNGRQCPSASESSCSGPIAARCRCHSLNLLRAHSLRICLFLPCVITICANTSSENTCVLSGLRSDRVT